MNRDRNGSRFEYLKTNYFKCASYIERCPCVLVKWYPTDAVQFHIDLADERIYYTNAERHTHTSRIWVTSNKNIES